MNILKRIYYRFLTQEKYAREVGVKIGENSDIQTKYFDTEPYLIEIGNNVMIMPGGKIPNDCIVGTGAVVAKSFDEDGIIFAGVPARKTGTLHELRLKLQSFNVESKGMTEKEKKDFLLKLPIEIFIKK